MVSGATYLQIPEDSFPIAQMADQGPSWRLFESRDVDETREKISGIMQPHSLSPVGGVCRHRGVMNYLPVAHVGIGTIRFGRMRVDVEELAGYDLFLFCLSGFALMELDDGSVRISGGTGLYVPSGEPFRGEFSEHCEQLVIRVDDLPSDGYSNLRKAKVASAIDFAASRTWLNVVSDIVSDPTAIDLIKTNPDIAESYARLLTTLMTATGSTANATSCPIIPKCIRRAERYMIENLANDISAIEIAGAAGVPMRTLQDAFLKFRQESPMRRLRGLRLDHARRLLQEQHRPTVTEAALASGLSHFGRFAHEYRRRFGEAPSRTRTSIR